jgi:hypothetical protein
LVLCRGLDSEESNDFASEYKECSLKWSEDLSLFNDLGVRLPFAGVFVSLANILSIRKEALSTVEDSFPLSCFGDFGVLTSPFSFGLDSLAGTERPVDKLLLCKPVFWAVSKT